VKPGAYSLSDSSGSRGAVSPHPKRKGREDERKKFFMDIHIFASSAR
jgi:hypothetical protein